MTIAGAFGAAWVFMLIWSVFYFGLHNPVLAFIDSIFLLACMGIMTYVVYGIHRGAAYLLLPSLLWIVFIAILTYLSI